MTSSNDHPHDLWIEYIEDVLSGKQVVGKYVLKAVEQFAEDLDKAQYDDYEWVFDPDEGERYIRYIQKYCLHTRGSWAGKPFHLSPWQQFFIAAIFGWKHRVEGYRRYRTAYLFVARKSGKTQLAAAIAKAMMVLDKEATGEYVFAATTREQAKIAFEELQRMCQKCPAQAREFFDVSKHAIAETRFGGTSKALASESNTLDGLSLQLGVLDEFHAQRTSDLLNVLKSSMGSRKSPLMLSITTAGFIPDGPCATAMRTAKEVLDGKKKDERTFTLLYELDKDDDFQDQEVWIKANPGLGTSITYDYLKSQLTQAQNIGGRALTEWLTKHGNLFQNGDQEWIEDKHWKANVADWMPTGDVPCYMGLDLASVSDVTSLALVFDKGGVQHLKVYHWLPEAAIKRRLAKDESSIYGKLAEMPNVTITPGNATDYDAIRRFVSGKYMEGGREHYDPDCLMDKYNVISMAYDRWNSSSLVMQLAGDGVNCIPMGQGYGSMSQPTKEFERMTLEGQLQHDDCELLDWMLSNVILEMNPAGDIKPSKAKSGDKIDGVAASIMAVGEYLQSFHEEESNVIPEDWMPRFL